MPLQLKTSLKIYWIIFSLLVMMISHQVTLVSHLTPYQNHIKFKTTEFLYMHNQMSAGNINILLDLWAATLLKHNIKPPFADCRDLYKTIDSTLSFKVQYTGEKLAHNILPWMDQPYDVWYHDPHKVVHSMLYSTDSDECQWRDFMSGDWAWNQADIISEDPEILGSMFVPVILRNDKTMVSVATGANDYYPLYISIWNILKNLKPGMTKPEIMHFGDGHYWHVIYGLGPFIADYEEQVLLACIVHFWCPRCMSHHNNLDAASLYRCHNHTEVLVEEIDYSALWLEYGIVSDIHELIAPDILHQLIKGTFKDHLVTWVSKYMRFKHSHVPMDVVCTFRTFLEFCYLVWCNVITESMLVQIQEALDWFHQYRKIFKTTGIIPTFSLPQQHSCSHYILLIRLFSAPNGLCSSITETKHIKAVKEPWRHSSHYKALSQMLLTNQCLDKLAVAQVNFKSCGMLNGTCLSATLEKLMADTGDLNKNIMVLPSNVGVTILGDNEEGEVNDSQTLVQAHIQLAKTYQCKHAHTLPELSTELTIPHLSILLCRFLFEQLHPNDQRFASKVPLTAFFNSACSTFYALSNCKHICACPVWRNEAPRYDCVFVNTDADTEGMGGMDVAQVMYNSMSVGIIHIDSIYLTAYLIPIYGPQNVSHNLKHYNLYDVFQAFYVNKFTDHHVFEITS
ncbi:hypothetical protein BD769DRAFT_1633463 [Suillus cothurnatus]|nr:hypothetical protein BD769DRAFT_1633463 [Suillus cothurnatus]